MIRRLAGRAVRRLLAAAGLARAADVEQERQAGARRLDAERRRATRRAAARVEAFRRKLESSHDRVRAEHRQSKSLIGLLRHYLVRLQRAETELAARAIADRRLKLEQLGIASKIARRHGVAPAAAERAAHLLSMSTDYATAVARWRAGGATADIRRVTLGHLEWSVPAGTSDPLGRRILDRRQLALDSLIAVRQFAVSGVMLDIGAGIGAASLPRVVLGDFAEAYAAEPESDNYLCLVANTLDNVLEGRVLPHRLAIASGPGSVSVPRSGSSGAEDVPSLTLDDWVEQLGLRADDVRFVRIVLRDWNVNALDAAQSLLQRRQIVWQIEADAALLASGLASFESFCARVESHFTHVKELGRYWIPPWRPAAEVRQILATLADRRRPVNVLLFNTRRHSAERPTLF